MQKKLEISPTTEHFVFKFFALTS